MRPTSRQRAALVALILLLSTGAAARPKLLAVPLISQAHPWSCGAAALMAALVYFGVFDEAESKLDDELRVDPKDGTRVTNMVAEARHYGLQAEARTGLTLAELAKELTRGSVVIAAIQAWPSENITDWRASWEDGHYVVVVGLSQDRVFLMDPSVRTGYAYLRRDDFLVRWHDYELDGGRKVVWDRLGIVIRGNTPLRRYPADPAPVE
jgi:predicted double-glycine peptidase